MKNTLWKLLICCDDRDHNWMETSKKKSDQLGMMCEKECKTCGKIERWIE